MYPLPTKITIKFFKYLGFKNGFWAIRPICVHSLLNKNSRGKVCTSIICGTVKRKLDAFCTLCSVGFLGKKMFNRYIIDFKRAVSLSDQQKKIANPAEQFTRFWAMKKISKIKTTGSIRKKVHTRISRTFHFLNYYETSLKMLRLWWFQ